MTDYQFPRLNRFRDCVPFWNELNKEKSQEEMEAALSAIAPQSAEVLRLHFQKGIPLKDICGVVGRSFPIVRERLYRGCFLLHKYFFPEKHQFNPFAL